jgi:UDP-glucose 4-epimerase
VTDVTEAVDTADSTGLVHPQQPLTWIIGAGGLLGAAVNAGAVRRFAGDPVPWHDNDLALAALLSSLRRFTDEVSGGPWTIVWAAGAATVSSSEAACTSESALLQAFLEQLRDNPPAPASAGVFFLTSSAGGLFAGAKHPPFTETSEPRPIGPYGFAKLANEHLAASLLSDTCPVIIGRFSNIYGPGQKLTKMQGLISRLALSAATRQPINLFVPLSTVRDYIYVDDAAAITHAWINAAHHAPRAKSDAAIRLIASGEGTSVGQLVRTTQDVTRRKVPIAMGSHPSSSLQAPDLRFVPSQLDNGAHVPSTSLPIGMKRVFDGILRQLQEPAPA